MWCKCMYAVLRNFTILIKDLKILLNYTALSFLYFYSVATCTCNKGEGSIVYMQQFIRYSKQSYLENGVHVFSFMGFDPSVAILQYNNKLNVSCKKRPPVTRQ